MDTDLGQRVLKALRAASPTSSPTSRHAVWLGASPSAGLVFVVRASSVAGVRDVRCEIDCGDRAVAQQATTARTAKTAQSVCCHSRLSQTKGAKIKVF